MNVPKFTKSSARKHLNTPVVWENLTAAEKRVWVAKDVLAAIVFGTFIPDEGYGSIKPNTELKTGTTVSVRDVLASGAKCVGCGIAAIFIAMTARVDDFTAKNVHSRYHPALGGNYTGISLDSDGYRPKLREVFAPEQIAMIECAYERCADFAFQELKVEDFDPPPEVLPAVGFGRQYDDRRERMVAIFSNIVANNGEFIP